MSVTIDGLLGISKVAEEADVVHEGDFGIGTNTSVADLQLGATDDLNDYVVSGLYSWGPIPINGPHTYAVMIVLAGSGSNNPVQMVISRGTGKVWTRGFFSGVWTEWVEQYGQSNILGTVSESAGVPTGAIIEEGSNANGYYTKFADGTMICRLRLSQATRVVNTAVTNITGMYRSTSQTWTLPAQFIDNDSSATIEFSRGSDDGIETWGAVRDVSTLVVVYRFYSNISSSTLGASVYLMAIGRWF